MSKEENCKFSEWDNKEFIIPNEYILNNKNDLADALEVFYNAGGYEFFYVIEPKYYASNWLNFIGNLYAEIVKEKYLIGKKPYRIPLTGIQKKELLDRGVPKVFVSDI